MRGKLHSGRWLIPLAVLGLWQAQACGSDDRPPFVDGSEPRAGKQGEGGTQDGGADTGPRGGKATSSGSGGKPAGGKPSAGAGDGPAGGDSPGSGGAGPDLSGDFDPNRVYVIGRLRHWPAQGVLLAEAPDSYLFGLPQLALERGALLRGNALLYPNDGIIRRFVPEAGIRGDAIDVEYPEQPIANDPVVDTPACPGTESLSHYGFLASPSGRFIYFCADETRKWYDADKPVYGDTPFLMALHDNGFALANAGGVEFGTRVVVNLEDTSVQRPVSISGETVAIRSHGDGFRVVVVNWSNDEGTFELWQVSTDGSAENLGAYPAEPDKVKCRSTGIYSQRHAALDPDDALYQLCQYDMSAYSALIRRTLADDSEVLFNESDSYLSGTGSVVITGP